MARTDIDVKALSQNAGVEPNETLIAAGATGTNGYALASSGRDSDVVIAIRNTSASEGTYTILAGDYINNAQGDLEVVLPAGGTRTLRLDGARFRTFEGKYNLDSGETGAVYAVK